MNTATTFRQAAKRTGEKVSQFLGIRPLVPALVPVSAIPAMRLNAITRISMREKGNFVSKCEDMVGDEMDRAISALKNRSKDPKDAKPEPVKLPC